MNYDYLVLLYIPFLIPTFVFYENSISDILNLVVFDAFLTNLSFIVSHYIYIWLTHKYGFLYLYEYHMKIFITGLLTIISTLVYQYSIYNIFLCSDYCDIMNNVYKSFIIIVAAISINKLIRIIFYIYIFIASRLKEWKKIMEIEMSVIFNDLLKTNFEAMQQFNNMYDIRKFVEYWTNKSDEEILSSLPEKSDTMFCIFKCSMDTDNNNIIDSNEFQKFCLSHSIVDFNNLWELFSDGNEITVKKLENILYNMCFSRKQFALKIFTDYILVNLLTNYIILPIFGAAFVFICYIWNVPAFDSGFNLFNMYILAITFLANNLLSKILFLLYMLLSRPINIGDIVLINDSTYKISEICPTYTQCIGDIFMTITNDYLFQNTILNLTRTNVYDSLTITLPLNYSKDLSNMQDVLETYAKANEHDIMKSSIRCGWTLIDETGKSFEMNWAYNFNINDRQRYNWVKTRMRNFLISYFHEDVKISTLMLCGTMGGAYNDDIKSKIKMD